MNISESKKVNPSLDMVEGLAIELNKSQKYEYFHEAWVYELKPLLSQQCGWDCGFKELQNGSIYALWVNHLNDICNKLK